MNKALLIALIVVAALMVWFFWPSKKPLENLKEVVVEAPSAEIQSYMDQALKYIAANKPPALMRHLGFVDEVMFEEYRELLFANGDFCPASVAGVVKAKNSASQQIVVKVHSEKRNEDYEFALAPGRKGGWTMVSIALSN